MPSISFSVFKEKILSGAKRQTIRKSRKYPIKVGDRLYLWWKLQSINREKLGDAVCTGTCKITINRDGVRTEYIATTLPEALNQFAIRDGFDSWEAMVKYFDDAYGLPFTGDLIEWE